MFRGGGSYRFLYRLVSLLVASSRWASRGYSLRLARRLVSSFPSIRPASRQAVRSRFVRASRSSARRASRPAVRSPRLVYRSSVFRLARFIVSRLVFSSRLIVSSSSPYSLVSPGGSSWRFVVSGSVLASRSFLFSSYIARCVSWPWRRLVICGLVSFVSWLRVSFPVVICHRGAWRWRGERAVRRYERCAVFVSSFPHRVMMMWRYE